MAKSVEDLPVAVGSENAATYKVLLINPNTSKGMTADALALVSVCLPPDTKVYGYTAPKDSGPSAIEGHLDGVLASASVFRDVYEYVDQVDACLVACFSEHPLTNCLRK